MNPRWESVRLPECAEIWAGRHPVLLASSLRLLHSMPLRPRTESRSELAARVKELTSRLSQTEQELQAIVRGEVDTLIVPGENGGQVFTREGTDSAYRVLVEAMNEGAAILDDSGMVLYCNSRLSTMVKTPLESIMGASLACFVASSEQEILDTLLAKGRVGTCASEVLLRGPRGNAIPVQLSLSPLTIHGAPGVCAVVTDLTERKEAEERVRSLALRDELTGLLNRRGFFAFGQQQLTLARRFRGQVFLLFADLDGLKAINDGMGHLEGDRALCDAADVLRGTFRESDVVARLGGDEFAILASGSADMNVKTLPARLQAHVDAHNSRATRRYRLSMSTGCVPFDSTAPVPIGDLLRQADAAMYRTKRGRRETAVKAQASAPAA